MDVFCLFLTLLAAALGAFVFLKLKIPAGAFLGSMIFVAAFNILSSLAFFPGEGRVVVRIFAGALIGARMKKADVIQMKTIILPAVMIVFGMLALNLSLGYGIHRLTGLELTTSLLGSAPGGIQDMALIADDMDADAAQVAVLHTIRILAILGLLPTLLGAFCKRYLEKNPNLDMRRRKGKGHGPVAAGSAPRSGQESEQVRDQGQRQSQSQKQGQSQGQRQVLPLRSRLNGFLKKDALAYARTLAFAGTGGFLLNLTSIPAGAMAGAALATVLATLFVKPSYSPPKMRPIIMTCSGALIGSGIGMDDVIRLKGIIVPAVILVVVLLAANFVFGIVIHKLTKLDLVTSLYASAAGGLTDMALIADEMGADTPKVAVLQILRLVSVVTLFPTILKFFSSLV